MWNHTSLVPRRKKLKIGTLQCFYIDQWLSWASAQGCLGRTRRRKHPVESSPSTPARSLSLATDLYKNTVVCLFLVFLRTPPAELLFIRTVRGKLPLLNKRNIVNYRNKSAKKNETTKLQKYNRVCSQQEKC